MNGNTLALFSSILIVGGQSIAKRLKQQLLRIGRRMRSAITAYNNLAVVSISSGSFPNVVAFKDVVCDEWPVWQLIFSDDSSKCELTPGLKRIAIDLYNMFERAEEERVNVGNDMTYLCNHLVSQYKTVVSCICRYKDVRDDPYAVGVTSYLISKAIELEEDIVSCTESFASYVDSNEVVLCGFRNQFTACVVDEGDKQSLNPAEESTLVSTEVAPDNFDSDSNPTDSDSEADDELLEC
jgi:hypothetical protein